MKIEIVYKFFSEIFHSDRCCVKLSDLNALFDLENPSKSFVNEVKILKTSKKFFDVQTTKR